MKNWNNQITAFGFAGIILAMAIWGLIVPDQAFSQEENRELQKLPRPTMATVLSGAFTKEFEGYTTDQFPSRAAWMGIKSRVDRAIGKQDNGQVYFGSDETLFPIDRVDERQKQANLMFLSRFLTSLRANYPQVRSSVLIAPTSTEILKSQLPKYAPVPEEEALINEVQKTVARLNQGLKDQERTNTAEEPEAGSWGSEELTVFTNPLETLRRHETEGVYYRTDHHWTTFGSYLAYRAWAQDQGLAPAAKESFEVRTVSDDFYGTSQSKTGMNGISPDSIEAYVSEGQKQCRVTIHDTPKNGGVRTMDSLYDPEFLETKDQYSYFLGGNHPETVIDTGVRNGKTLLLIKDSYAHCFAPFLTEHFQRIVMVDLRYFKGGLASVMEKEKVTDVMFLCNVIQFCSDRNLAYLRF